MESEVARFGFGEGLYSLKSNSWKSIQNLPSNHRYFGSYIHCLNSALHWLTNPDLVNTFIILTLDLVSEKYHEFPTPEGIMHSFPLPGLTVLGGCLCFIVNNKAGSHVWAMKEYGVTKSWVMLFSIDESDVPWTFAACTPLRFSKSGQMVVLKNNYFEPPDSLDKISWYDMEKKRGERGNLQLLDGNAVIVQRRHQDPSTSKKRKFANRQSFQITAVQMSHVLNFIYSSQRRASRSVTQSTRRGSKLGRQASES
ncbi:hypothetical protein Pyn_18766 [Prunus yedoensis var. nudiflora]|uniref:F-box protein CPR30-like n=1 Tax=Prunus yedoensis var. nudiflora TaxID=2094558 RepID=A0A314YS84_PRUYE|nr:hypothetical protein Pyn_18766 [Prunus yedoensis var. nudiflora]